MFLISFSPQGHITLKWMCLSWNQFNIVYQWINQPHYYPAHPRHNIPASVMDNGSQKERHEQTCKFRLSLCIMCSLYLQSILSLSSLFLLTIHAFLLNSILKTFHPLICATCYIAIIIPVIMLDAEQLQSAQLDLWGYSGALTDLLMLGVLEGQLYAAVDEQSRPFLFLICQCWWPILLSSEQGTRAIEDISLFFTCFWGLWS